MTEFYNLPDTDVERQKQLERATEYYVGKTVKNKLTEEKREIFLLGIGREGNILCFMDNPKAVPPVGTEWYFLQAVAINFEVIA
jgi:hypothetical protein